MHPDIRPVFTVYHSEGLALLSSCIPPWIPLGRLERFQLTVYRTFKERKVPSSQLQHSMIRRLISTIVIDKVVTTPRLGSYVLPNNILFTPPCLYHESVFGGLVDRK
jgi:hypothetical protein